MKAKDVVHLQIPRFKELSVKRLIDYALSKSEIRIYLPEGPTISKGKRPEREFFWGIITTIDQEYAQAMIESSF